MEESLSIEETNKIRLSLGLKPLKVDTETPATSSKPVDAAPDNSVEAQERRAVDNWKKRQDDIEKENARKARIEGIKKARDAEKRFAKLEGKGLGEADENEEDTTTWVRKMKKRQKKLAEKMAKEMEDELQRAVAERKEYTAEDLTGVRVGHDLGELDGEGTILTLKDTTIEENEEEGDELISTDIAERERLKEQLDLKRKKPTYNAYEDEDENGEKRILAQYDEEIDGKKKKRFVLDGTGSASNVDAHRKEVAEKLKAIAVTLDPIKPEVTSDYVDPSTLKIRQPKKKKTRATRKRSEDDDDSLAPPTVEAPAEDSMEVDSGSAPAQSKPKRVFEETSFVDDDDLQSSLAAQRRIALKKRKVLKPGDLARQLREESAAAATPGTDSPMKVEDGEEEPGLVIDETSEFVATLRAPVVPERRKSRSSAPAHSPPVTSMADEEGEDEDKDRTEEMDLDTKPEVKPDPETGEISSTGLAQETTIAHGVGATLAMLHQRGLLTRDSESDAKINLQRDREKFRTAKRLRELEAEEKAKSQRLRDRQSGKFDRMSAREREEHARWENKQRDHQEAKEMAARFKEYKPDVKLSYKDEFGREMSQKEAFKHLSHQFHGKGSGKAKTEKRLKKIEDEKKREAASSLNASATENAVQSAAKKSKQAGVRLM
ncbi:SART-1 protein [Choiromyces venosus 120613-1]|uniref:SART-1 protein n=1 Tax=Choiromyces venosus 120613-1 TaxID=1336337 RepID=A0A3N4JXT6_9PEZI|nr:SART-1 protein [Choiromyces venosus 120613-1]